MPSIRVEENTYFGVTLIKVFSCYRHLLCFRRVRGDPIREEFLLGAADRLGDLVVIAAARRAGDPGSIPGPGENFFSYIINNDIIDSTL